MGFSSNFGLSLIFLFAKFLLMKRHIYSCSVVRSRSRRSGSKNMIRSGARSAPRLENLVWHTSFLAPLRSAPVWSRTSRCRTKALVLSFLNTYFWCFSLIFLWEKFFGSAVKIFSLDRASWIADSIFMCRGSWIADPKNLDRPISGNDYNY